MGGNMIQSALSIAKTDVKLYEGKYYLEFIESDLDALLRKAGIEIKEEIPILFGAGRILKGIKKLMLWYGLAPAIFISSFLKGTGN